MVRKQNWPALLASHIEGARERPFAFGTHDCLLFAADAVQAITGTDVVADLRGTYHDERSALAVIHRFGSMRALAEHLFGEAMSPQRAWRGDVVLVLQNGRESLAVCESARLWAPGVEVLQVLPMTEAVCAWRI